MEMDTQQISVWIVECQNVHKVTILRRVFDTRQEAEHLYENGLVQGFMRKNPDNELGMWEV
jgi:hypothetical protein